MKKYTKELKKAHNKSFRALDVFRQTKATLHAANGKLAVTSEAVGKDIDALLDIEAEVEAQINQNFKTISRIDTFLGE